MAKAKTSRGSRRNRKNLTRDWQPFCEGVDVFRFENNEAVREIITGRRNHEVGGHFSFKMGDHAIHESGHEERGARTFDCMFSVRSYFGQPEAIRINSNPEYPGEIYTPDFLVENDSDYVRYEIKELKELQPPEPLPGDERAILKCIEAATLRARLRRVRAAYAKAGVRFEILTDVDLLKLADPEVVDEVIANAGTPITPDDLSRLECALLAANGQLALGACEDVLREAKFPRGAVLSRIVDRHIQIDLKKPISRNTQIQIGEFRCP
jgi:hypothetical protein